MSLRRRPPLAALAVLLAALAALVAGCGGQPDASPSASAGLPSRTDHVPTSVAGATEWREMDSQPSGFDPDAPFPSAVALADAFGAAIDASFAGADRPRLDLDTLSETDRATVLLVTETGVGDDSVAGSQYALFLAREDDGWRLEELWTRALCVRGVDPAGELCV